MDNIYGTYNVKIDDQNRIAIPSKAKPLENEKFVLVKEDDVCLYSVDKFDCVIDDFRNKIDNCKSKSELEKLNKEYLLLLKRVIKYVTCDKTHRIIIDNLFNEEKSLVLLGDKDKIRIMTKDKYNSI